MQQPTNWWTMNSRRLGLRRWWRRSQIDRRWTTASTTRRRRRRRHEKRIRSRTCGSTRHILSPTPRPWPTWTTTTPHRRTKTPEDSFKTSWTPSPSDPSVFSPKGKLFWRKRQLEAFVPRFLERWLRSIASFFRSEQLAASWLQRSQWVIHTKISSCF